MYVIWEFIHVQLCEGYSVHWYIFQEGEAQIKARRGVVRHIPRSTLKIEMVRVPRSTERPKHLLTHRHDVPVSAPSPAGCVDWRGPASSGPEK